MATSTVKYSRTSSCVRWSNGEEMNVSRTVRVLVFRELTQFTFEWYLLFKNGDTFSQKSKRYWLISLMLRVWCIMNLFPGAIAWIILFTKQFCYAFKMQFIRNYLANCFQYLDSTPEQCTFPSGPERVSVVGPAVVSHLPYQIWPPVTSSCFPGWRSPWKGKYFMKSQKSNWIKFDSCTPFWSRSTTDTMNSGRISWNFCIQPGGSYSGENNSGWLENAVVFLR